MMLLAQHGYGKSTKIDRGISTGVLSGVILSPKDESETTLVDYIRQLKASHKEIDILIDPQYYHVPFPNANYRNLSQYSFYPGHQPIAAFRGSKQINKMVADVVDYQIKHGTTYVISPSIIISSFTDREAQIVLSLAQEAIDLCQGETKKLLISLTISENAFSDALQMNNFLNEISILDAAGFYIIVVRNNATYNQHFESNSGLVNLLTFIYSLSIINEFKVVMGYSDLIGLLYLGCGADSIATGWHNGLRKFSIIPRILPASGGRQPRPRYCCATSLLNTILLSELDNIHRSVGSIAQLLANTPYDKNITTATNPLSAIWDKDTVHMQHWHALSNAMNMITKHKDVSDRLTTLMKNIASAQANYAILEKNLYIPFDNTSNSSHLKTWQTALQEFRNAANV